MHTHTTYTHSCQKANGAIWQMAALVLTLAHLTASVSSPFVCVLLNGLGMWPMIEGLSELMSISWGASTCLPPPQPASQQMS